MSARKKVARGRSRASRYWLSGHTELVAQWHPTKNGILTPEEISYGSGRRIWWKCPVAPDHEWRATPNARTSNGTGCPFCANVALSMTNNLRVVAPDLALEWDEERNGKSPDDVIAFSSKPAWWRCPVSDDHVWRASPNERLSHGAGCPFCTGRRVSRTNSLQARAPETAREWHPTRNRKLSPDAIVSGSPKRVWWLCARGHAWMTSVANRTVNHSKCPICARVLRPPRARGARELRRRAT